MQAATGSRASGSPVSTGDLVDDVLALLAARGVDASTNLICLSPIKERLAARWPQKREQVWTHVEAFLKRQLRSEDMVIRIDELNVLVVQPGREPLSAQTTCVRASAELMRFFIGECTPRSVQVRIVDGVDEGGLIARDIDGARLESMLLASGPDISGPVRSRSFPLLTRLGRSLSVELDLKPMWMLKGGARVIGHYAEAKLLDEDGRQLHPEHCERLQPGDLAEVDITVLRDALALRAASPKLFGGLIIPLAYPTLANSSTRYQLLQAVQALPAAEKRSFGWEITGLQTGIPSSRLSELVGMANAQSRGVICRMEPTLTNAEKIRAAGATLSITPSDHEPFSELALFRLESQLSAAAHLVKAVLAHGVPQHLLPVAGFAGVTHCVVGDAPAE